MGVSEWTRQAASPRTHATAAARRGHNALPACQAVLPAGQTALPACQDALPAFQAALCAFHALPASYCLPPPHTS
eukprot:366055-Chlamydomonas_euryale.AAC.6